MAHYDDEIAFQVRRLSDLVHVIVPFMETHLPCSYKREQFESWSRELNAYWEVSAKRVRPCAIEGCEERQRAHGLCRRRLYRLRGV